MVKNLGLPVILFFQRFFIILAAACCLYAGVFFFSKTKGNAVFENTGMVYGNSEALDVFDLNAYSARHIRPSVRDIFSLAAKVSPSGVLENNPKGRLPDHLKVVCVLIGHPSQIIIEDKFTNKTLFISDGKPAAGIKIVQVKRGEMTINYQGQDIPIVVK